MKWKRPFSLLFLAFALPAIAGLDRAHASYGVHDQAGLFSQTAIRQGEQAATQIYNQFRKDVLVETFAGVPAARMADYQRDRESFFNSFLQDRARGAQVNGVYLMIMKEAPPHNLRVQVGAGRATRQQLFRQTDQDEVVRLAKSGLRSGDYDRALRDSISAIADAFQRNSGARLGQASAPQRVAANRSQAERSGGSSIGSFVLWGGLILIAIMVISALFRRMGRAAGGVGMPGTGAAGGGGFLSSLFGGIAGAMAGSWLYDRFFGSHPSADSGWTSADSSGTDVGSDFASSGGDVDDDTSKKAESDFGSFGGDFGGGDFDGGDSGGSDV